MFIELLYQKWYLLKRLLLYIINYNSYSMLYEQLYVCMY